MNQIQLPTIGYQLPTIGHQLPQVGYPTFPQMLELAQQAEKIKEKNEINITKKEISDLLTQDSYYRKMKQWPLLTFDQFSIFNNNRKVDEIFHVDPLYYQNICNSSFDLYCASKNINERFPNIDELLLKFKGHLIACGGAIFKSIFDRRGGDIDLFFYNLTIEEADKMRLDAIEFLINLWKQSSNGVTYTIKRNEYTTTLYVTSEDDFIEYQFIHRIYPNMSSIIGGFDLSICMVAYDGEQIYATPLGAWSIKNSSIIIDTKRCSTSFEYRLIKYKKLGIRLIFPGISNQLIKEFINENSTYQQMINKVKNIAKDYGYNYNENCEDFDRIGGELPEYSIYNIQKKEDILPYFRLFANAINVPSYDRINIEDRLTNKISDYSSLSSYPTCLPNINAQQLRSDNLHSVSSILNLDIKDNIREQLIKDIDNPNLMIDELVVNKFHNRVEKIRIPFKPEYHNEAYNNNIDFYRLLKCFGKLTPKVIETRHTDEYYEYRDIITNKMLTNAEICMKNLIGIKWITQNPGRQWTSSINPIIADPREWYGKHYIPVITGIPSEIEATMRLMRLPKTESLWTVIPDDVFNVICIHLLRKYADDAWSYI